MLMAAMLMAAFISLLFHISSMKFISASIASTGITVILWWLLAVTYYGGFFEKLLLIDVFLVAIMTVIISVIIGLLIRGRTSQRPPKD